MGGHFVKGRLFNVLNLPLRFRPVRRQRRLGIGWTAMTLFVLAATLLMHGSPAWAGGFTVSIMGGRRASSLVNLARPDDPSALFHNPAGLADLKSVHLHLSNAFYLARSNFRLRALDEDRFTGINPQDCGEGNAEACPWPVDSEGYYEQGIKPESLFGAIPYLAATSDLSFLGEGGRDVVAGLAVYAPSFYGARMPEDAPSRYSVIDGMFMVGSVTFGVGWRLNQILSLGLSLSYNYMRVATTRKVSTVNSLTPAGEDPSAMGVVAQDLVGDLNLSYTGVDHGMSWVAGVLLTPWRWLSVGLSYWGSTKAYFDGPLSFTNDGAADLDGALSMVGYKLPRRLQFQVAIPHSLGVGISVSPVRWLELSVDLRTWHYQFFDRQEVVPVYDSADQGTEVMTADDLSTDLDYIMSYDLAWGLLVRPLSALPSLEIMAGASYDRSPVPDRSFSMENPSLSSWNLAVGVRYLISSHWRVTLSYLQYFYVKRDIDDSALDPPVNGQATGTAYLPAFEIEYIM
jgi:long-subunit fatty acid transport protein